MSDMQFNTEQQNEFGRPPEVSSGTDWTAKIISWGLASNRQQAEYVMIGIAVLALVLAFFLYRGLSGGSSVPTEPVYNTSQI